MNNVYQILTTRDCPRVAYYATPNTTNYDVKKYFSSSSHHCVIIEHDWFEIMKKTTLYIYEFDVTSFCLQDQWAGYYVSEK